MKRIILLLGALLMLQNSAMSMAACECQCPKPYDLNSKFRTVTGNVVGWNFLHGKVAQAIVRKAISKTMVSDNLKVKFKPYSAKDTNSGIFKSLSITGDNVIINKGIHLSSLEMKTVCDFNYIKQKGDDVTFMEDFPMTFKIKINAEDLNKTMKSPEYKKIITKLNDVGKSHGGIKITSTKASIKNNKFYYILGMSLPFIKKEQKITLVSDLAVRNNSIDFKNSQLLTDNFKLDLKKVDFILGYLNPLNFSVEIFDNKNAKVYVNNVGIHSNTIETDGIIVIPSDVK